MVYVFFSYCRTKYRIGSIFLEFKEFGSGVPLSTVLSGNTLFRNSLFWALSGFFILGDRALFVPKIPELVKPAMFIFNLGRDGFKNHLSLEFFPGEKGTLPRDNARIILGFNRGPGDFVIFGLSGVFVKHKKFF